MNVLVDEKCLKDIAESIRRKGGLTKTYKPREMSVAIDNLQTGGSGCLVKIEQSANQKITATYNGKTYTDEFFVLIGESFETSIKADNHYTAGTVNYNGTPLKGDITVRATEATETPKYKVTIEQSANQTITATYDGQTYTSTFYAYEGSRITFAIKSTNADYDTGTLNYTEISSLNSDVTVKATPAIEQIEYAVPDGTKEITQRIVGRYKLNRAGKLIFPPSVKSVGNYAFYQCASLTSVSLPACTSVGSGAFNFCNKLQTLILSDKWTPTKDASIPTTATVYNQDKTKKVDWNTMSWVNV